MSIERENVLPHRLRLSREETELTQEQVAGELKLQRQSVHSHEKGNSVPSPSQLITYCRLYGKSADYLLGISNENLYSLDGMDDEERKQVVSLGEFFKKRKKAD